MSCENENKHYNGEYNSNSERHGRGIIVFNNKIKIDADWENNQIIKVYSISINDVKCENYEHIYIKTDSDKLNYFDKYNDMAEKQIILFEGDLIIKHKNLEDKQSYFIDEIYDDYNPSMIKYEFTNKFYGVHLKYSNGEYVCLMEDKYDFYKKLVREGLMDYKFTKTVNIRNIHDKIELFASTIGKFLLFDGSGEGTCSVNW